MTFELVWLDLLSVSPKYPSSAGEITELKRTHFLPVDKWFSLLYKNAQHVCLVACRCLWSKSEDWFECSMNGKVHMWGRSSRRKTKQRLKESHGLTAEDVAAEVTRSNVLRTSWQVTSAEDPSVVTGGWQQGHSTLNKAFHFLFLTTRRWTLATRYSKKEIQEYQEFVDHHGVGHADTWCLQPFDYLCLRSCKQF